MKRAIERLVVKPDLTLIAGGFAPKGLKNCKTIINGDEKQMRKRRQKDDEKDDENDKTTKMRMMLER